MKILVADDEKLALEGLISVINEVEIDAEVHAFTKPKEVLKFAKENIFDIAFLDIEMRGMTGLELAKQLKEINPKVNIIFVTGYSSYMGDAFSLYVSGYITKPATREKVLKELDNLRYPIEVEEVKGIRAQCFGNFEVFTNGIPVKFQYQKTKEMLAYLIDRKGAACTTGEIIAALWEDEEQSKKRSYMSNLISDLINTFSKEGIEDVIIKRRGNISIIPEKISCDFYDWSKGIAYAVNSYQGEYMTQYSWAEITLGEIECSL